jgi:hypothetical protein
LNAAAPAVPRRSWKSDLWLILAAVVMPNAVPIGGALFGIGTQPRTTAILLYVGVAIVGRMVPRAVTYALFLGALVYDVTSTIALSFGLSRFEIIGALRHARELAIQDSPLYAVLALGAAGSTAVCLHLLGRRHLLAAAGRVPAVLAGLLFAAGDFFMNTTPHFHFASYKSEGQPFESAALASGFDAFARSAGGQNALFVLVESLGVFVDPRHRTLVLEPLDRPDISARYHVTRGEVTYYGSTTAGELRELCATREPYTTLFDRTDPACLPFAFAAAGYATLGVHGFNGTMFDRVQWWPNIGLGRRIFGEELARDITRRCGSVLLGLCDLDVAPRIGEFLAAGNRRFVYWLTLNSHVPVQPGEARTRFDCGTDNDAFGQRDVCSMAEILRDLTETVAAMALRPDLPPTEILLVGDHAPPLWSRRGRRMFVPGRVPWVRLVPRAIGTAATGGPPPG